ncbi:hypothetical protein ASPBRDRAFT_42195 [Aspergillus brasiliensis CBS 101740]|uniref:Uncharacterized protein n=1 Tax=Aspergillus brasiliensis (strain CBS 101740 / IMI 381727 / IBT 21946) TaxID=767769 RepID=A0A1L9ULA6_ASPBC|nr:hypothetical protein ASPBRDRAFT_42195 [Aspergillus brasiliensis CBS 101740]
MAARHCFGDRIRLPFTERLHPVRYSIIAPVFLSVFLSGSRLLRTYRNGRFLSY